jgi:MscS family membrane protein
MPGKYLAQLFMLAAFICLANPVFAQDEPVTEEPEAPVVPIDEFDRGTPRRAGEGFMSAVDKGDYVLATEFIDTRNLRGEANYVPPEELARQLSVVINRAKWTDVADLIDDPAGRRNDGLPDYRDLIGVITVKGSKQQLWMQKVPRGDGVSIWKVSNATMSLVPDLYDIYGYPDFVEDIRQVMPKFSILGFELFKWVIALTTGVVVYVTILIFALATRGTLDKNRPTLAKRVFRYLAVPVGIWASFLSMNFVASLLGKGVTATAIHQYTPIPTLLTVWLLFAGITLVQETYARRAIVDGRPGAAVLSKPLSNAVKILVVVGALLFYLDKLGMNITTVLAGLGVGGLAVALALQRPMEDIFGALTLYAQQPVRVGDFCTVGKYTGTIEEIGLRTTRIRTLANTVIAVPNAQLANEPIDNVSARRKILFRPNIRVRYETTPDQIEKILDQVRELFANHERVLDDGQRVRFVEIGEESLVIEAFAYVNTTNWPDYLEIAEELNIAILRIVNDAGTSLFEKALFIEGLRR